MSNIIQLNKKDIELRWSNLAQYRISKLPSIPKLEGHRVYASACEWVWAMLPKGLGKIYREPEDVAEHIGIDEIEQVIEAITGALEDAEVDSKKKNTSTTKPKYVSKRK